MFPTQASPAESVTMKLLRALKWILISGTVVIALTVAALFTLDLGFLRGPIEQQVQRATGRAFSFDKSLSIRLGRAAVIEARGVRMANADWASQPDMLRIERLSLAVDIASLWQDTPPTILQFEVEGLELFLADDATGRANWVLGPPGAPGADAEPLPFLLKEAMISGARIEWQTPRLDRTLVVDVDRFNQSLDGSGTVRADAAGNINDRPFDLSTAISPWERLLSGEDLQVEGRLQLRHGTLLFNGQFDDLWQPRQPEFSLLANSASLAKISETLGIRGLGDGPVSIELLTQPAAGRLSVTANATVGELEVDFLSEMSALTDMTNLSLQASASGPNFGRLARLAGADSWPESPFSLEASLQRVDDGLNIDQLDFRLARAGLNLKGTLPAFPSIAGAEARLELAGEDMAVFADAVGTDSLPAGPFSVSGTVDTGDQRSTRLDLVFQSSAGKGRLQGAVDGPRQFSLTLDMQGDNARRSGSLLGIPGLPAEPWQLELKADQADPGFYLIHHLELVSGGLRLAGDGQVGAATLSRGTDVNLILAGDRLSRLQGYVPAEFKLPDADFEFSGRVQATPEAWRFSGVDAQIGTTRYLLEGALGMAEDLDGTWLSIEAQGTDAGRLFDLPGAARLPDGPFMSSGRLDIAAGRLGVTGFTLRAGALDVALDGEIPWPPDITEGRFLARASGENITRILPELAGLQLDVNAFRLDAEGAWQEGRLDLKQGRLALGGNELRIDGILDLPPDLSATNLNIELRSPDVSSLGTLDGRRWGSVPFSMTTSFSGTAEQFSMKQLDARLGNSRFEGRFGVNFASAVPEVDLRLSVDTLNLRPFLADPPAEKAAAQPRPDRIIPDTPLTIDVLKRVNGRFAIAADTLLTRRLILVNNLLSGELRDGQLQINELGTDTTGGRLAASMMIQPDAGGPTRFKAGIHSRGLILNFTDTPLETKKREPPFDIDIDLEGRGDTLRALVSSLNGSFILFSPGGEVVNTADFGGQSRLLAQLVSAVSPVAARRQLITVSCFAAVGVVNNGLIDLQPGIALQSDRLNTVANGSLNLSTEQLDIRVRSRTRSMIDFSAGDLISPYVKLSGTLAKPAIIVDPKGTLLSGGAAALTGGLSLLARKALDQFEGDKPCARFLESAEPEDAR